jgi:LysM repeat protein
MPSPSYRPFSSPEDARSAPRPADEPLSRERLIPFPGRAPAESEPRTRQARRRRPDAHNPQRSATPRRARRRRHSTSWLQRNALSIAALSVLVAMLGLGFGVAQMLNRPDSTAAQQVASQAAEAPVMVAASVGPPQSLSMASVAPPVREVIGSTHVLEPNYTVDAGDTLGRIATRYNTSVERIQAFNNIPDARALRIGARLVIPPPL